MNTGVYVLCINATYLGTFRTTSCPEFKLVGLQQGYHRMGSTNIMQCSYTE